MILKYDEERHDYIVEDLDDENHLVIKESQLQNLKARLDHVRPCGDCPVDLLVTEALRVANNSLTFKQDLDEKMMQLDESDSE